METGAKKGNNFSIQRSKFGKFIRFVSYFIGIIVFEVSFGYISEYSRMTESDVVAVWNIPMSDKMYKIEFEHGTTSGKRVVRVNGKVVLIFLK